ncbi:MAG TPA: GDP-mannose 4,6-dehydratase [bacterium]|nr:GDP-mannose 4,6-dehydratase [bacterium]HPJ71229.1 GDP-mannose 4,6-dehydratase [bacterium]
MKGTSILVTGGTGFIGSHLVRRLYAAGARVAVITKYNSIFENVRLAGIWDKLTVIEADIRNLDSCLPLRRKKFDVIFHLAAYNHVGDSFTHVGESFDVNARGTANLLDSCRGFQRFVYISSSEVYGLQPGIPFRETASPLPISPYSIGKYGGELYCRMRRHAHGLPIAVVRPFNAFGPYQSAKAVIPELIIRCLKGKPIRTTEGLQTREFNYVENLVDGIIAAGAEPRAVGEVVNLGSGRDIAIRDLVKRIHSLSGSSSALEIGALPHRPTEIWKMAAANRKAASILNWKPKVSFEEGLKITIEWYREYLEVFENPASKLIRLGDYSRFGSV